MNKTRRKKKLEAETDAAEVSLMLPEEPTSDLAYLAEDLIQTEPVILALVPPDLLRCQCEWLDATVATFGPKPLVRCDHEPVVVAFQKRVRGDSEPTGAMALCEDHRVLLEHMYPGHLYYRRISREKQIGGTYVP